MKATVLSLTLLTVTGCSTLSSSLTPQSTQATQLQTSQLQTSRLNTANTAILSQASPSAQASTSPRFATDRQNQIDSWGYNEGKEDGRNNFPASFIGTESHSLTDPAEKKIYTDAYTRGYADGKAQLPSPSPSPSPSPTTTVSPARRTELQQKGRQSGVNDAQSGFAANPGSGIATLGLTDPTEIQLYTDAYNAAYQQPTPTPTASPGQLAQLRQQGYQDGYADAQSGFPKDVNRGINLRGLVATAEQRAYSNSYSNGYQKYLDEQGSVVGGW